MKKRYKEIRKIIEHYGDQVKPALTENSQLETLYALSVQREALLEWYPFEKNGTLLQIGADYGALTGLFSDVVSQVTVLDADPDAEPLLRARYQKEDNITVVTGCLADYVSKHEGGGFDYVTAIGSMEAPYEEFFSQAKSLLKPGGVLIVAACNPFGIKYWAGARKDDNSISRKQLLRLLGEGTRFYYPMPDYKLPMSIYTDDYLPKKGDLTDAIIAYDYPKYIQLDTGARYDEVCEDGQFDQYANSYLVFWSQDRGRLYLPDDLLYAKFNQTRREEFQIRTAICQKDGQRYVEKAALRLEGSGHIWSFKDKYQALLSQYRNLMVVDPVMSETRSAVMFPYLQGVTWAEKLGAKIREGGDWLAVVREAMALVYEENSENTVLFTAGEEFYEVFGTPEQWGEECFPAWEEILEQGKAYAVSNIDGLFENMMVTEDGTYCLDYEWVFGFPVPLSFVKYRTLYYFHRQYQSVMGGIGIGDFLSEFGISSGELLLYQAMELCFQDYVHGDNQQLYLGNYLIDYRDIKDFARTDAELELTKERLERARLQNREKDATIRKMTEVQRLTNNHVTNLEVTIENLRREVDEMGKTLTYLNDHEAIAYKFRRKLGQTFNEMYPKGSAERKRLNYQKEYLLHPVRSMKLYSSPEGKNLREGDFAIGDAYRTHGKLKFAAVDEPMVSIVIPVYNQIHYTYACLVSILEHTEDVSYEVIIADDVSTDATEHLADFAEGLVICRNSSNQGFLRNCNQAARQARGRYVMFLNNDTQVTAGWLSSLVALIESDHTIGMVGSKLVYPDGRLQEAGGIIWDDGSGWNYGRLDDPDKPEYNYVKDVDYISGAAIMLAMELWNKIGGFDTRYAPAYCEDSDLAFEVRRHGYRVVYQPLSKVIHFEGISNGTDVEGSGLKRYQAVNSKKLKEKWADEFALQCVNTGNPDPFRARERSKGKPIILVVDHYVPTYDKDAGSKTTFQYLKLFLSQGYMVKFLGDNYLHEEPYSTALQQMGIEILYGADYQVGIWDWLRDHGDDIAFAYLNRPHIAGKYIDYILDHTKIKVIYYGHDLHFLREGREYELTGDPERRQAAEYWKAVEFSLMQKAAVSYYPSYVERNAIKMIDEEINVKVITAYVYESFKEQIDQDFSRREGLLFVGGFAHPPNADAVLWFAAEIWPRIREELAIPFYIVGSKVTEEIQALETADSGIVVKGFVSEEELEQLYADCKLVIVPLRYGAGVKGKVVEAIYYGAPIVTTSIGAEGLADIEGILAVADAPEDFARTVLGLYRDDEACRMLSKNTQSYIRKYFSPEAVWKVIEDDFVCE